jgi:hypothetical protein
LPTASAGSNAGENHVAQEIRKNRFRIAGGKRGMKVSWQVTGVRRDAFAMAHPFVAERDKPEGQRGAYLHPAAFQRLARNGLAGAAGPIP